MILKKQYKDFSWRLHAKGERKPIAGQCELTHRCNLACQHCYIVNDAPKKELTYAQLCRLFDEIHQEGCLWLCFSGGEPLLREDFLDIYSYAFKKGFILSLFTNATLFTKEIAGYLRRFPPFLIDVTVNGVTQKTYESITQTPGSFAKAMEGIENIRLHALPLRLKCQAMTLNYDELPLIRKFFQDRGVAFRCSHVIEPRMDGASGPCALRLPLEKVLALEGRKVIANSGSDLDDDCGRDVLSAHTNTAGLQSAGDLFRCAAGRWTFYVNPFGEFFMCSSLRQPAWSMLEHRFREVFYDYFTRMREKKFIAGSQCSGCVLLRSCLRCPGRAALECGDAQAPIEYYCRIAHAHAGSRRIAMR